MTWKAELTRRDTGAAVDAKLFDHTAAAKRWVKSHQNGVRDAALPELAARIYDPDGALFQETSIRRGGGWRLRWRWAPLALLLALAAPLAAQEPEPADWPPPVEEPAEEPEAVDPEPLPGLYLSAWCSLKRGEDDAVATCDQGLAGALASWDPGEPGGLRASWVLFGGAETVGTGGAISRRISDRVVLGVGAGVVIPIPEEGGLETDDLRLAVGVTASFW